VERDRWSVVVAGGLTVFMAGLDLSIVNVALPSIGADLGLRPGLVAWVVLGYMLPVVALGLPSGRWLDQVGKRSAFVFLVAGFAAASAVAGAAGSGGVLVAARVAQGAFGAPLFGLVSVLVVLSTRPRVRGRAMAVVATVGPLGAVSGPALGGVLVGKFGWPAIFYVNIPISLVLITIALRQLPADGRLRLPDRQWLIDASLIGGAATVVLLALSQAPAAGLTWLLLALAAAPLLWAWWRRPASRQVIELLRSPGIGAPVGSLALVSAATGVAQFLTPFYLQQVLGRSPQATGLTILAFPLATAALGPAGGILADRWGARRTVLAGTALMAAGLLTLAPLPPDWHPADLAWRLALVGAGMGLFAGPNQAMVMSLAPRQLMATTGAATAVARSLGFALGPALGAAAWALTDYSLAGMRAGAGTAAILTALAAVVIAVTRPAPRPALALVQPGVAGTGIDVTPAGTGPPALGGEDPRGLSSAQADHGRAKPAPMRAGGGAVAGCPQDRPAEAVRREHPPC
jgi:DHA2 family multidrug resistance protein-like MFS transporter